MTIDVDEYLEGMAKRKSSYVKKNSYKGGIEYKGEWYRTKLALWEAKGNTKLGTFRSRIHRGMTLEQALGDVDVHMG